MTIGSPTCADQDTALTKLDVLRYLRTRDIVFVGKLASMVSVDYAPLGGCGYSALPSLRSVWLVEATVLRRLDNNLQVGPTAGQITTLRFLSEPIPAVPGRENVFYGSRVCSDQDSVWGGVLSVLPSDGVLRGVAPEVHETGVVVPEAGLDGTIPVDEVFSSPPGVRASTSSLWTLTVAEVLEALAGRGTLDDSRQAAANATVDLQSLKRANH